jgi:integrase
MKITLRKVVNCGNTRWLVDRKEKGKRKRSFFTSRAEAEAEMARMRAEVKNHGEVLQSLGMPEREALLAAWIAARERGHDLRAVLGKLAMAPAPENPTTCGEALRRFLASREEAGCSPTYIQKARWILEPLVRGREDAPLGSLDQAAILAWMSGREGWTRATMRTRVQSFCRYALAEGWISEDPTTFLSLAQHEASLRHLMANPRALAWYVLSAMCGLRPNEAQQMTWSNVWLDGDQPLVRVEAATSKVRQRRVVYILPAAAAWLRYAQAAGAELPLPWQPRRRALRRLREALGLPAWPQDITRHTAASYWLAQTHNAAAVAEALGHSVNVLRRHYRAVVTREEAARFWGIMPPAEPGTVQVDFRAAASAREIQSADHRTPETSAGVALVAGTSGA